MELNTKHQREREPQEESQTQAKAQKLKACVSEKVTRKHEAKIWKESGRKFMSGDRKSVV